MGLLVNTILKGEGPKKRFEGQKWVQFASFDRLHDLVNNISSKAYIAIQYSVSNRFRNEQPKACINIESLKPA